jgi:hypothetical protein
MSLTTVSWTNKQCATCGRWAGSRQARPPYPSSYVEFDYQTPALCMGGGFSNAKVVGSAACGQWIVWDALRSS